MKVLQSGRLGNFLFQWAFANHLANLNNKRSQIIFDRFHSDISQVKDLQEYFNSDRVEIIEKNLYGYGFKTLDYLAAKTPQTSSAIQKVLRIYTEGECEIPGSLKIYRGFFQDSKFAISLNDADLAKLLRKVESSNLDFQSRNSDFQNYKHYQVAHLRLGDFKNSSFGVIKLKSMLDLLQPNLPTVICTDGSREEIIARIGSTEYEILTPTESNAWETLSIITSAKRVVSSNSTMSWWGAFLAKRNGAEVFLPTQWRKDEEKSVSMQFPGAQYFEASFE